MCVCVCVCVTVAILAQGDDPFLPVVEGVTLSRSGLVHLAQAHFGLGGTFPTPSHSRPGFGAAFAPPSNRHKLAGPGFSGRLPLPLPPRGPDPRVAPVGVGKNPGETRSLSVYVSRLTIPVCKFRRSSTVGLVLFAVSLGSV